MRGGSGGDWRSGLWPGRFGLEEQHCNRLLSVFETVNSKFELEHEQALEYWAKTAVMMLGDGGLKMPKAPRTPDYEVQHEAH
jgi:hypothetical protein